MPDIFIPIDTLYVSDYYNKVWNSNVLYRYTLDFNDRHRKAMDKVTTIEELDAVLDSESLIDDFVAYAERNSIECDQEGLDKSREVIEAQIRAYIGRNAMADEAGFYHNIYPIDEAMQRAVEELSKASK